jgi:hypothetical protein
VKPPKFVHSAIAAVQTDHGIVFLVVATDTEGELWFWDSGEREPGPRWRPLPIHPRAGIPPRRRRRS